MLYLAWDREINISLFFCDVFVWKWGFRPRTSSRCYHGNKSAATFKKGILVHPPECLTACKILRGLKIFISQAVWFLQRLVLKVIDRIAKGKLTVWLAVEERIFFADVGREQKLLLLWKQ